MSKITTNFIYNVALTISTFLINLIIFPYVSRILGVDNIGRVGFVNNVISYFSLFALLGIRTVGIREIAAAGNDRKKRSEVYSSLMSLLGVTTFVVTIIYIICVFFIPRFAQEKELLLIGTSSLFFTSFLIEWFYQGIEDFRYITIRTVLIKILYAVAVFAFVKAADDIYFYYILTVLVVVVNSLINLVYSKKFCDLRFYFRGIKSFLKPIISLGAYNIMVSMYTTFNVIYLGFVASDAEVGYYYTSTKVYSIIIGVFFAFTGVMLPRMSSLISENRLDEYKEKISKSFDMTFAAAIPIILYCVMMAPEIIRLFAGSGFDGAILPMRIVMPIILLSGMAQIWIQQILVPYRKDKIVFYCAVCGAVVGVIANILLVKNNGAIGSALVLLMSEFAGSFFGFVFVMKNKLLEFPSGRLVLNLFGSIPYVLICLLVKWLGFNNIVSIVLSGVISLTFFLVYYIVIDKKSYCHTFILSYIGRFLHKQ